MVGDTVVVDCVLEVGVADPADAPADAPTDADADADAEGDAETRFGSKLKTSCKFARMAWLTGSCPSRTFCR